MSFPGDQRRTMLSNVGKGVLALLFVLLADGPGFALDLGAFWLYRASGGEQTDTIQTLEQRYRLGAGPGFTYQPTRTISARGDVSYNVSQRRLPNGDTTTIEELTPSGSIAINNNIFRASLFGTESQSRPSVGADRTSRSWEAALGSGWTAPLWPNLRFNYGRTAEETSDREIDTESTRYGAGFDWDLLLVKLYYDFSHARFDDLVGGSRNDTESHFARAETGGRFWQDRVDFTLSQQVSVSTSRFSIQGSGRGRPFERLLDGVRTQAAVTPANTDPVTVELTDARGGLLGDGDLQEPTLPVPPGETGHLGMSFETDQQVDLLHVYVASFPPLLQAEADTLNWALYTRRVPGQEWDLVVADVPAVFNLAERRFELPIGLQVRELKVVVTNPAGRAEALQFTELDAIRLLTGNEGDRVTNYVTNLSVRMQLARNLTSSAAASLEQTDSKNFSDATRWTTSGNLRWTPIPQVVPSASYSETRERRTDTPEAINRSYSLTVMTFPLPTLTTSLGATRTEEFSGAFKTATSDRYSLFTTAQLYPDLTASWDLGYRTSTGRQPDAVTTTRSETWSSRLALTARITPKLTGDLTTNYQRRRDDTGADSTLSFGYRPSPNLSTRLTLTHNWTDETIPDSVAFGANLALLRTQKARLSVRYDYRQQTDTTNSFGLDGGWDISRKLTLQGRANYAIAEVTRWTLEASLSLNL